MTIICDSREKKNEHIKKYFDKNNIDYIVQKMDVADYQILENDKLVIDRKQSLDELAKNLMNKKDHSRFWKEVRRAKEKGIKMVILCEHGGQIKTIPDVAEWHSKYSTVSGRALMNEIYRVHIAYGVEFLFCDKRSTGRRIIEILGGKL
jgi:ERCC4-type nuclease